MSAAFGIVVDSFEGGVGAWTPSADVTLSQSTIGATDGSSSMQIDVAVAGWKNCALFNARAQAYRSPLGVQGVTISMDVTASPGDFTGTWMNIEPVINGQNYGTNNNVGWNTLGGQDIIRDGEPHRMTWVLPEALVQKIAATDDTIAWFELGIISNTDAATRKIYVDNVQISEPQVGPVDYPFGLLIGNFEEDLDGWAQNDATFTRTDVGKTRGDWALQSVIGTGGWHIHGRLDAKPHRQLLGAGARIVMDVTVVAADNPGATWMNVEAIINGQNDDQTGPQNNIGWRPLGGQDVIRDGKPHTYVWRLPSDLREKISHVTDSIWWFELMIVTNNNASSTKVYIDNIWLYQEETAEYPDPADGATGVANIPLLTWVGGAGANRHDVFFGSNADSVAAVTRDNRGEYPDVAYEFTAETQFEPGILDLSTPYYWRVDALDVNDLTGEVLGAKAGKVWTFTVGDNMVIDGFESYADGTELMAAWKDANSLATTIAKAGGKSMKIVPADPVSHVLPAHLKDWMQQNLGSLELYFYGDPNNTADPLYVRVVDGNGASAVVSYGGAAADLKSETWTYWQIPLREFAGVNRTDIATMYIGVGNPLSPKAGTGRFFIDDIRLYQGRCLLDKRTAAFATVDFAPLGVPGGDCVVDMSELATMVADWLNGDSVVPTSANDPNKAGGGLIGHYRLDDGSGTTAVNSTLVRDDGTLYNGVSWITPGYDGTGSAIHVNGADGSRVFIGTWDPSAENSQFSLSVWIRWAGDRNVGHQGIIGKRNSWANTGAMSWFLETDPFGRLAFRQYWEAGVDMYSPEGVLDPFVGQWAHVAVTFDGTTAVVYLNGAELMSGPFALADKPDSNIGIGNTHGGGSGEVFVGDIDEVQIYNRTLSAQEVAYLADMTRGDGQLHVPVASKANLSNSEPAGQQSVNLADFAVLAYYWLDEQMWP